MAHNNSGQVLDNAERQYAFIEFGGGRSSPFPLRGERPVSSRKRAC
jgi:hypothetical protein